MRYLLFLCCATALASTSEPDAAVAVLERFAEGLNSYQARFDQTVTDEHGQMVEQTSGLLMLQAPKRLRWHYQDTFEQLIVADGDKVWLYDVELEQITVRDQAQAEANSPLYALSEPASLVRRYRVESGQTTTEESRVRLLPRSLPADFEWIELGFKQDQLSSLTIRDGLGQHTAIQFSQQQRNQPLEPSLFRFEPPAGVDVLVADGAQAGPSSSQ